jgi:hypothetical protein
VQLEPTRAEVTPRAGAWVDADRLRGAIKKAGFKPGEIRLIVAGTLAEWKEQPAVRLALKGRERLVVLQAEPGAPEALARLRGSTPPGIGQAVEVEGRLIDRADPGDKTAPAALRVQRLEVKG